MHSLERISNGNDLSSVLVLDEVRTSGVGVGLVIKRDGTLRTPSKVITDTRPLVTIQLVVTGVTGVGSRLRVKA